MQCFGSFPAKLPSYLRNAIFLNFHIIFSFNSRKPGHALLTKMLMKTQNFSRNVSVIPARLASSAYLNAVIAYSEYDLILAKVRINGCLHGNFGILGM